MKTAWVLFLAVVVIGLIVAAPLALIWACNVLFATAIPFTLRTWFAALLIEMLLGRSSAPTSARSR